MQGEIVSKWCREHFNDQAAEKELKTSRKGTFLVWRGSSQVDLYLSYVDHAGATLHLPIKQLGRLFFLEGARFHSLPELVVHHLTMREYSETPVKIAHSHKRDKLEATHIALADIATVPGQPPFCVRRGDLLSEVGRIDDRWLLAQHLTSGSIAFFDLTQTSILNDMDAAPDALPYFHECLGAGAGDETQDEVVQRLAEGGRGSFLLRRSRQSPGAFALLVHTGDKIDKFLVEQVKGLPPAQPAAAAAAAQNNNNNNSSSSPVIGNGSAAKPSSGSRQCSGWRLSGRVFATISHIVHRYSVRPMQAEARLTHAVLAAAAAAAASDEAAAGTSAGKETNSPDCSSSSSSSSSPSTSSASGGDEGHGAAAAAAGHTVGDEDERGGIGNGAERVVVASVCALYKTREDKDWRKCGATLYEHAGAAILRLGDTSRGDRHTLVLHHTELVCLHESLFGREATVFLAPLQGEPGVFLAFEPLHFHYTWFHLLRRYTVQRRCDVIPTQSATSLSASASSLSSSSATPSLAYFAGSAASGERTEMSLLSVHVDKYKGEPLRGETAYRAGLALNGVSVAATPAQLPAAAASVVFDAHFLLLVTSWSCSVQLTLHAAGKSRPTAISAVMGVPLESMSASMTSSSSSSSSAAGAASQPQLSTAASAAASTIGGGGGVERKTSSTGQLQQQQQAGPFALTMTRHRVIVLTREAYAPLLETLFTEVLPVAEWASRRLPAAQRSLLCSLLVSLAWPHSLRALLECTLGRSIAESGGENMLRQDSFASGLITAALRASGKTLLEARLAEDRPKKEAQTEDWLVSLLAAVAGLPSVSLVLSCVAATVAAHLPPEGKEHVVRRAISAAFVLRFANPLIIGALPAAEGGPHLARAVQTAANAAATPTFARDPTGASTATRLYDLFERVRERALHTVMVEAYDTAPEQCALLCHLLALALSACPAGSHLPSSSSSPLSASTSTSSSTITTTTFSSSLSSSGTSSMSSSTSCPLATTERAAGGGLLTGTSGEANGLSASMSTVSSSTVSSSVGGASKHPHPELTPSLARLLELHRT